MPDLMTILGSFGDLLVALVLLVLVLGVFIGAQAGLLPKGARWMAVGAAGAIFLARVFNRHMADAYHREIKATRKRLKERDEKIEQLTDEHEELKRETAARRAALREQLAALETAALRLEEDDERVREELSHASLDEIDRRFAEAQARLESREGPEPAGAGGGP